LKQQHSGDCDALSRGEDMTDLAKYGPWALIVGGSEGVGAAFARKLAADGFKLILVARKTEPLQQLADELSAAGAEVRIASVDMSRHDALSRVRERADDLDVGLLIYVAGANNTRGNFVELDPAVYRSVIAINVIGQSEFARHYGALMRARGRGGIILSGSLSGYMGSASLAAYTGAKAFSRIFSEALWAECAPMGIDVLHLNIGFTATPAMARLGMNLSTATAPEVVAREGLDNIGNGPVWIAGGEGNREIARQRSVVDGRAAALRKIATPSRESVSR
jgi:short-subunit dehydrogenase